MAEIFHTDFFKKQPCNKVYMEGYVVDSYVMTIFNLPDK